MIIIQTTATRNLLDNRVVKQNRPSGRPLNVGYVREANSATDLPHTINATVNKNLHCSLQVKTCWWRILGLHFTSLASNVLAVTLS